MKRLISIHPPGPTHFARFCLHESANLGSTSCSSTSRTLIFVNSLSSAFSSNGAFHRCTSLADLQQHVL